MMNTNLSDNVGRSPVDQSEPTIMWPRFESKLSKTFYKLANPASFIVYFRSFQANIITIFTTNMCEKMSIQYIVPGFEPTTFGTWVSYHDH